MRRRWSIFLLCFAVLVLAVGCGEQSREEAGYTIYYENAVGTSLLESRYVPKAETFDELMEELFLQLESAPAGFVSTVKSPVKINGYERGIDALRIDFSQDYYALGNTDEVLLRAAVVKTFSQIPGVTKVMITVNQEQLHDAAGKLVPAMDADSFIDTKEGGINSYLYAKLDLFFPNESGEKLAREHRSLHYSSNMVLERVIIEQLIAGPEGSGLRPIFTDDVKIQNLYSKNGICTVSFDEQANRIPADGYVDPETALYAIVNSICSTCDDITGIRFEIEGDSSVMFRDEVSLDRVFERNTDYLESQELSTESEQSSGQGTEADGESASEG